jgi:integrase
MYSTNEASEAAKVKHLSEIELRQVLECARQASAKHHAMLLVGYLYALRNQEIASMTVNQLDFANGQIMIERSKNSISAKHPLIAVKGDPTMNVVAALKLWLAERGDHGTDILFPSQKVSTGFEQRGRVMSRRQVSRIFERYCQQASDARVARGETPIPQDAMHAHALKHTRATVLVDRGAKPQTIQSILGHKSILSTARYMHPSLKQAWAEARRLEQSAYAS